MKRLAFSILSSLVMASPAFAIVGGPWDNNMFFGRQIDGTFQGTISGKNLSGIMMFGTTSTSSAGDGSASSVIGIYGADGRAVVFVDGVMVVTSVTAVADISNRKLNASLIGSTLRAVYTYPPYIYQNGVDKDGNPTWDAMTYSFRDVISVSGNLDARFVKTFPVLEYSGSGTLEVATADTLYGPPPEYFPYLDPKMKTVGVRYSGVRTSTSTPYFTGTVEMESPAIVWD